MQYKYWNKKIFLFYIINLSVIILSSLLFLYAFKNGIQSRIALLKDFSPRTIQFLIKTIAFILFGYFSSFVIFTILKIHPVEYKSDKKSLIFLSFGWILFCLGFFALVLKDWAMNRFPLDQPEIVWHTLNNLKTANFDKSILFEGIMRLVICFIISLIFFVSILIYEIKQKLYKFSFLKLKNISVNLLYLFFGLFCFLISLYSAYNDLRISEYPEIIERAKIPPVDSEFFKKEYIKPENQNIIFPDKKRNLIILLVESMESSFCDTYNGGVMNNNLIPETTRIAKDNINFSPNNLIGGGIDLSGTGWTIAGMTAKFAGLPFNLMGEGNLERKTFLPNAITLTDILNENGYKQRFIFGSDKHFAGRDALLESHGNVEVHDIDWYKKEGLLSKDYYVFWGFEDLKLFDFAKRELNELSASAEPFMFGLLTVDTHMPTGYQCEECPQTEDMPLKNTIKCTDKQVADFVAWAAEQPWYDNTTIVIMGDHLFMATAETSPFPDLSYTNGSYSSYDNPRRWLDVFINPSPELNYSEDNTKNRLFSSLDMFPTILAAMGCKIEGERLGFGVNLFSDEKTLCERYDEKYLNSKLMERSIQYLALETNDY